MREGSATSCGLSNGKKGARSPNEIIEVSPFAFFRLVSVSLDSAFQNDNVGSNFFESFNFCSEATLC